jgi:hypothetical protein
MGCPRPPQDSARKKAIARARYGGISLLSQHLEVEAGGFQVSGLEPCLK